MEKYIKIACLLLVIIAVALFVKSRWNAWFVNQPEPSFVAATTPDRITITPGEDFMTERTISWRCGDTIAPSSITLIKPNNDSIKIDAIGTIVKSRGGIDAFYHVQMNNLEAGKQYKYYVTTNGKTSQRHSFTMPQKDKETRQFLFFGDVQDTINGNSNQWFAKLYKTYPDVEFWACAGDLIERPIDTYFNYFYQSTDSILASIPLINATGNHDYLKSLYPTIDARWQHTFVYPQNGPKIALGLCYYIDFRDMRFIILDTQGINDCITLTARYQWLKKCLANAKDKWKIVMYHHPAYSVRKNRNNFQVRNTFVPLIEKYGVHLVLQGHEHGYMTNIGTCGYHPVYVVSYMSPKSYPSRPPQPGFKIIPNTPMYHIIDYNESKMVLHSYALATDSLVDIINISR